MASNNKSPQFIKISEADLIEAGILPEKPKLQDVGPQRQNTSSKRQSGSNSVCNIKKTRTTISRRTPNINKELVKKAISNIENVANSDVRTEGEIKFIPLPAGTFETWEKELSKNNVRKELFKQPVSTLGTKQRFKSRTSTQLSGKFFKAPRTIKPTITVNSPLLEMNKFESVNKKKSVEKSPPTLPLLTPSRLSTVREETNSFTASTSGNTSKNEDDTVRSSISSNFEFEAMEQICYDHESKKVNVEIKKILSIIKTDQEEFKKYKEANDQRMSEITSILNGIVSKFGSNKENLTRKPSKPNTPKRTPLKNKFYDLRKNVLSNTLGNTPKEQKAAKMYNSLRDKYQILGTPKFDKKIPNTNGGKKTISDKIQEQCLMLMDTPKHKQ